MIDLTPEQQQALRGEGFLQVRDPQTGVTYLLVPEDLFRKMQKVVDGFARSAGWDDPELDVYEQYRNRP